MRPISKPKPKLSSPERVWYWRKAPIAATCRRNDSNTIRRTDRGRAGKLGRSITGEFIRSHQKRSSSTMVWNFWDRTGVHLEAPEGTYVFHTNYPFVWPSRLPCRDFEFCSRSVRRSEQQARGPSDAIGARLACGGRGRRRRFVASDHL